MGWEGEKHGGRGRGGVAGGGGRGGGRLGGRVPGRNLRGRSNHPTPNTVFIPR